MLLSISVISGTTIYIIIINNNNKSLKTRVYAENVVVPCMEQPPRIFL